MKKVAVPIIILVAIGIGAFLVISYQKLAPEVLPPEKEVPLVEEGEKSEAPKESKFLTGQAVPELVEIKEIKRIITTKVEGTMVKYQEDSLYSENDFSVILKNEDEFSSQLREEFTNKISKYGKEIIEIKAKFNPERNCAILICNVGGVVSKTGDRYYSTFEWLIRPFGLDFIDDNFMKSEQGLSWEGEINGIPTKIICRFPFTGQAYNSWAHPTGHCHAHVWWTK